VDQSRNVALSGRGVNVQSFPRLRPDPSCGTLGGMDPKDPYRAAKLLIDQHGRDAKSHAMQRVLDMRAAGDERGEWVWMGVFDAVLELETTRPAGGQSVH
jgi:hypothetical protein